MTTKTMKIPRRACEDRRRRQSSGPLPTLSWWRNMHAGRFNAATAKLLRETVAAVAILGEPAWGAAVAGDARAAIGLALRLNPKTTSPAAYDLIMTVLLACAAEGDAASCLAMSHALRRSPGAGRAEARIATSWLVRSFVKLIPPKTETGRAS